MSNSKLATWKWSGTTDHYNTRDHKIDKITPHHQAGNGTLLGCCNALQSRGGSVNYIIQSDGKIGVMVDEQYRAWTSSSRANDMRAVTIEVANSCNASEGDKLGWPVSDKALAALINLCVDICKRNNIKKLNFTGDTDGNLTMHKMFAPTGCPGPYLESKFPYIASEVNKRLKGTGSADSSSKPTTKTAIYRVRKSWSDEKSQIGAFESLDTAKKACKAGYSVFDNSGKSVYSVPAASKPATNNKKSNKTIAKEVIAGKWGNGEDRKKKLEAAGYSYITIQNLVNQMVNGKPAKKSNETIAKEVIQGKWGNGEDRKKRLEAAGYSYSAIQAIVNKLI